MSNLKVLVEEELRSEISIEEMERAERRARQKLDWIIKREGDANGERLKPWYLVHLISEAVCQYRLSAECLLLYGRAKEKDCAAL
ncbi:MULTISPECIES: hypothetical protein [unclassified Dehalobacter]|uniref:hypothetical protein n=1 Tax=unclassified Dehalobacter TaxID=2635733 RepID=UPI0010473552|nr:MULTISPECIES: hypothetical protein [unclassified Dehalobacter]TCX51975.1 hypothetical protein C1I36_06555 [Dehalobacter sp. 14DCB1]TCX53035.1 hypothetical protein C1I38_08235 [Dehalobacter sp. 12DCB1]